MEKIGYTDSQQGILVKMSRSEWGMLETLQETAIKAFGSELETANWEQDMTPVFRAIECWTSGGFYLVRLEKWLNQLKRTLLSDDDK